MTRTKLLTNKTFVLTAVVGSLLVLAMMTANTIWSTRQTRASTDEAVSAVSTFYLEAIAEGRARTLTNLINSNFEEMEKAIDFIEDEEVKSQEELRDEIGKVKSLLSLNRFAVVDTDNIVYTQYTTYTGGSRHPFLFEEHLSGRTVSIVSTYGSSKKLCLAIPTSGLVIMGKPFKACFVQMDIQDIIDILGFDNQGKTFFALYSKNGGNLSGTELGPIISNHNILDATKGIVPDSVWNENCDNFKRGMTGSLAFATGELEETLCYAPIQGTEWEMAVLIRESVIQDQIRDISAKTAETARNQILFALVSVLILAVILLHELRNLSKAKIEQEKEASRTFRDLANKDTMTGVRNKHAYTENEMDINQKIQAGELRELAVVVCDINGLKHVNDTQGHSAGDQLIKDACALICDFFTHGAVFRVGGDEFVVLLQGKGYDTMTEVIDRLNRKIEANIEEDAVVVSIGYSVLEEEDRQLSDVFERADKMMYERKKELKELGAKTRH